MVAFENDIRDNILRFLPHDADDRVELEAADTSALLVVWFNWTSRLVTQRPRRVHWSHELEQHASPHFASPHVGDGVAHVAAHIEAGDDLSPHLSKAALQYGYQGGAVRRRQDLDLMINDWRIHHLHLGIGLDAGGYFAARTDELLFAHFRHNDAFLIDVGTHGDWAARRLLEVVVHNWPDVGLVQPMAEGLSLVHEPTDEEYLRLRRAGVAVVGLTIDGRVWSPTGFMSTARTSLRAVDYAYATLRVAQQLEEKVRRSDAGFLEGWPEGISIPDTRDWHFDYSVNGYWLLHERNSNVGVPFD